MRSLVIIFVFLFSVPVSAELQPYVNVGQVDPGYMGIGAVRNIQAVQQQRLQNELLELQIEQARRGLISFSSIKVYEPPQTQYLQPAQSTYAPVQPYTAPNVPQVRYITGGSRSSRNGQQKSAYEGGSINSIENFGGNVGGTPFQGVRQSTQTTIGSGGPTMFNSTSGGQIGDQQFQTITSGTVTKIGTGDPTVYNSNSGGQIGNQRYQGTSTITQKTIGTNGPTVTYGNGGGQIGNQQYMSTTEGNMTTYRMGNKMIICTRTGDQTSCR